MSAAEDSLGLPHARPSFSAALKRIASSPRFYVYISCTVLAVLTSYHLGKEMLWDTMDYHVYAGFSALYDRFGRDYFAAGPQGYFNPYAYVPFYLLLRSSLTPFEDASILAALQSAILWLTYEMALAAVPRDQPAARLTVGVLAVVLAFANPVMVNQLGSSYADITTAEVALAGWLALVGAIQVPSAIRMVVGALLLGAASALKPTNAVHAVSAAPILLFVSGGWWRKCRYAALFAAGVAVGFALVSAPWSIRLEQHFGNPVFPLLNGVFHSPEFTTAPIKAYTFVPVSFGAALLRPFKIAIPLSMVQVEWIAPDVRYALLLFLTVLLMTQWLRRRARKIEITVRSPEHGTATRIQAALGVGLAVDWTLWLTESGNGRYFIPMACVAAVLCMALVFRVFAEQPKIRNYLLAAVFSVQLFQLYAGTEYRAPLPWGKGPWFSLAVPAPIASEPNLYFMMGELTNSFVIPYLPREAGFINLNGEYVLGADGPSGTRIESLIKRFAPHLRVLVRDPRLDVGPNVSLPDPASVENMLEPFGLRAETAHCSTIVAHGVTVPWIDATGQGALRQRPAAATHTEYLVTCPVAWSGSARALLLPGQRAADLAFDHLEDACPALFQPQGPVDSVLGDKAHGYGFARRYLNTNVIAWIGRGWVRFQDLVGGGHEYNAGPETAWEKMPLRVACGRAGNGFFKLLQPLR